MTVTEYLSSDECVAAGLHLTSCDRDGFCNYCGEQEPTGDESDEAPS